VDTQQLCRLHLEHGDGARVSAQLQAEGDDGILVGRWLARGGRFFLIADAAAADSAPGGPRDRREKGAFAEVGVDLETGVHRFRAWLRPVAPGRWEVVPGGPIRLEQRRASVRVPFRLALAVRPLARPPALGDPAPPAPARTLDVSLTGVAFETAADLPVGTAVRLEFEGDTGQRLGVLTGRIVRRQARPQGYVYGARFDRLSPKAWGELTHLLVEARRRRQDAQRQAGPAG
jgi:hypothetical protein